MGWIGSVVDGVESVASDVGSAVESGAEAVGGAVASGAEAVGGAVSDGASWVGNHAETVADGALAVAGMIPAVNVVTEGAQALYHTGAAAYDVATGDYKGAAIQGGEALLHGAATALNLATGEGGEALTLGADAVEAGVEGATALGADALSAGADAAGATAEVASAGAEAAGGAAEAGGEAAEGALEQNWMQKALGVTPVLEEHSAVQTGLEMGEKFVDGMYLGNTYNEDQEKLEKREGGGGGE